MSKFRLMNRDKIVFEGGSREECLVIAFERHLVYDFGKKRNSLLPGVKVVEVQNPTDPFPG